MTVLNLQHNVAMGPYTTLEVGGPAQYFVSVTVLEVLPELIAWARAKQLPIFILGGGSNLVVCDQGVLGLVIHLAPPSQRTEPQLVMRRNTDNTSLDVRVAGHVAWDDLVAATCREGAYGLACLSGIPGRCGAAPVQNIGAYGQSLQDSLVAVETVDLTTGAQRRFEAAELGLGYRTSYFKTAWLGRYVIVRLALRLEVGSAFVPEYAQLTQALAREPKPWGPEAVRQCVLQLRSDKSMLWTAQDHNRRSVGSFFTNPTVQSAHAQSLSAQYPAMPAWPQGPKTKLSAAWLIEQAGFDRGFCSGPTGLSTQHTLALINRGGARAQDVIAFGRVIQKSVRQRFGVGLSPEASFWGFGATHPMPAPEHTHTFASGLGAKLTRF